MFRVAVLAGALLATGGAAAQDLTGQFYLGGSLIGGYVLRPTDGVASDFGFAAPEGFAGYNLTSGNVLFGVEASLYGHVAGDVLSRIEGQDDATPSRFLGRGFQGTDSPPFGVPNAPGTYHAQWTNFGEFVSQHALQIDQVRTNFGGSISGRVGLATNDALFYLRLGGGVANIHRLSTTAFSGQVICDTLGVDVTVKSSGGYTAQYTGCEKESALADSVTVNVDQAMISPTIVAGIGAEKSWDQWFVRGEVVMTHAFYNDETSATTPSPIYSQIRDGLTQFSVSLGGGVRF